MLERIAQLQDEPLPRQTVKLAGREQWYRIRVGIIALSMGLIMTPGRSLYTMCVTVAMSMALAGICLKVLKHLKHASMHLGVESTQVLTATTCNNQTVAGHIMRIAWDVSPPPWLLWRVRSALEGVQGRDSCL